MKDKISFHSAGKGGWISETRIVAIGRWDSAPVRRMARLARSDGKLIDLTFGEKCVCVYFLDSGHVVLGSQESSQ